MDWLGSDHVGTRTGTHAIIEVLFFLWGGPCREDVREYGNGRQFSSVQLSVEDSHRKLGVEEELEVSL
jgi:hypothetical protein